MKNMFIARSFTSLIYIALFIIGVNYWQYMKEQDCRNFAKVTSEVIQYDGGVCYVLNNDEWVPKEHYYLVRN